MNTSISIQTLQNWLPGSKPLIIAGPCSVESAAQVEDVAMQLKSSGISVLRGGIWKPRTHPGTFKGMGNEALNWLVNAAKKAGLKSAIEVANPDHVEAALNAGIDILWIGARSTVSPFTVQEIADSLKGCDIPVMIKNPINPDLELWIGAVERLSKAGIDKMIAIHRGFSSYEKQKYRNVPNWEIPLELKRLLPELPLICDPSHICGSTELIPHIAQKAMDLNFEGLMIEVHPDPAKALSDKEQQLKPEELKKLLHELVIRSVDSVNEEFLNRLHALRRKIDKIDYDILELLAERNKLVTDIGHYKKENNVSIFQPERWEEIIQTRSKYSEEIKLSKELIIDLVKLIHRESIAVQTKVMNEEKG